MKKCIFLVWNFSILHSFFQRNGRNSFHYTPCITLVSYCRYLTQRFSKVKKFFSLFKVITMMLYSVTLLQFKSSFRCFLIFHWYIFSLKSILYAFLFLTYFYFFLFKNDEIVFSFGIICGRIDSFFIALACL